MGTGYTRNDTPNNIADGNVINASDLDGEFDAVQAAFNGSTGHSHDGTTGEGPQIDTAGLANGAVTSAKLDTNIQIAGTLGVTGVSSFADGSNSAPSLTFTSDTNTGIYRGGTDILKFVTAGTDAITIDASQNVDVAGTVTADGLTVDGLVGIGRTPTSSPYSASEQIQIGDTGVIQSFDLDGYESIYITENSRWDSTGYLQAIQTSESSQLRMYNGNIYFDLHDSVTAGTNQSNWRNALHIESNGDISFYDDTGVTQGFFWDASTQNLGVGVTNPSTTLHIKGGTNENVMIVDATGTAANYIFDVRDDGTSKFRVDPSGNVGIGTASPSELIHANGSSVSGLQLTTNTYTNGTVFKVQTDGSSYIYNTENAMLRFGTNNLERLRIDTSGNVGIGTTSPSSFNSLADNLVVGTTSGENGITIASGSANSGRFVFSDNATGAGSFVGAIEYSHSSDDMILYTATSERMRILSTGGITFNGDTATANALDDYEEGTWTPSVVYVNASSWSCVDCNYTKIGRMVFILFRGTASVTSNTTATNINLSFPFTQSGVYSGGGVVLIEQGVSPYANLRTIVTDGGSATSGNIGISFTSFATGTHNFYGTFTYKV